MPQIYDVALPNDVKVIVDLLSSIFTFGLQGVATTPLQCLGLGGYVIELLFWMGLPVFAVSTVLITVVPWSVVQRLCFKAKVSLLERVLPPVLQIMFVLYPLVMTAAFEGFPCYEFENGQGWLIADVSIECNLSLIHISGPRD